MYKLGELLLKARMCVEEKAIGARYQDSQDTNTCIPKLAKCGILNNSHIKFSFEAGDASLSCGPEAKLWKKRIKISSTGKVCLRASAGVFYVQLKLQ